MQRPGAAARAAYRRFDPRCRRKLRMRQLARARGLGVARSRLSSRRRVKLRAHLREGGFMEFMVKRCDFIRDWELRQTAR